MAPSVTSKRTRNSLVFCEIFMHVFCKKVFFFLHFYFLFFDFLIFVPAILCNSARVFFAKLREFFSKNCKHFVLFRCRPRVLAQVIFFIAEFLLWFLVFFPRIRAWPVGRWAAVIFFCMRIHYWFP